MGQYKKAYVHFVLIVAWTHSIFYYIPPPQNIIMFNTNKKPTYFTHNTSPFHLFAFSEFAFDCMQISNSQTQTLCSTWLPLGSTLCPPMTILIRMFSGSKLTLRPWNLKTYGNTSSAARHTVGLCTHKHQDKEKKKHLPYSMHDLAFKPTSPTAKSITCPTFWVTQYYKNLTPCCIRLKCLRLSISKKKSRYILAFLK